MNVKRETFNVIEREVSEPPPSDVSPFTSHVRFPALDALLLLFIVNLTLQPLVEPDFGWHLRSGLDLPRQAWRMPATDPYSHSMPDWPWVNHAWLTDGLLGLLYRGLGPAGALGVIVFFAAVTMGAFLLMAARSPSALRYRLAAVAGALWVALPFLGARTQLITLLGLAVLAWLLQRYQNGQASSLWLIPPLFLLWANLHGGFTAGLFLLLLWLLVSAALRLIADRRKDFATRLDEPLLTWSQIAHLAVVLLLAALATLANPYGWRLHGEILASLSDRFMIETLEEWHPLSLQRQAGVVYVIDLAMLGLAASAFYRRVEPLRWAVLLVFLLLSLRHWRNLLFFLLFSAPLWADLLAEMGRRVRTTLQSHLPDPAAIKRGMLGLTLAAALVVLWLGSDHLEHIARAGLAPASYFRETEYPIEAVEWIRDHRGELGDRLYNDYGYGGFLLWWLPEEKIFIDGRMPAWRIGDRWIFRDYIALTAGNPPELGVLQKYGVDWALVGRETPLDEALAREAGWKAVYEDAKVTIYVQGARS